MMVTTPFDVWNIVRYAGIKRFKYRIIEANTTIEHINKIGRVNPFVMFRGDVYEIESRDQLHAKLVHMCTGETINVYVGATVHAVEVAPPKYQEKRK